ncbi:chemotaxis protein CheR [Thiohalorhabdus denitrificans]|uniref:protein-glutamate O-methyltransferase n=1 Tax=Thiohalorhabdus denitrificans TaxID=381306 RepID=A0A0P9C8E0_9GAMM|nr:chemotaxis protein CheB [Thiohalorhabdus denitrificans]KPV39460.1 chemotaxis protein CheR [Thiohalorhabdus denitrificans]SCY02070.1 two-component system, chemotaxis family, CheB/CheR fusion protein [Thiohalorhabdus denitrificans]
MSQSPPEEAGPTPASFPVVGIGGSAGSLKALQELLETLPEKSGVAFVVVTHHPSGHRSMLPEILEQSCDLPVVEATGSTPLEADHVYIAIPDAGEWRLADGFLVREEAGTGEPEDSAPGGARRKSLPHAVDTFFRSLAAERGRQAAAIVLSGTGTDGTLGIKAIKAEGGMVMAQDPASAEFGGMPTSAINTNLVDYVLSPGDMGATLLPYLQGLVDRKSTATKELLDVPEKTLDRILESLRERTGNDFSGYKQSTLLRRLERRMHVHRIEDPEEYADYLARNPAETDLLFREVIISVTNFFRDPEAWEALADGFLPDQLRAAADEEREFRAWVIGCATGEEAYTLAILVTECMERLERRPPVQIFATDVDSMAIDTARGGRYAAGIAEDLTEERLARFFVAEQDAYRVSKEIRDMVVFAEHNALRDPPFTRLDLVSCRNLLIYLERDLQRELLPLFRHALRPLGLLFLGASESVDDFGEMFTVQNKRWRIYRAGPEEERHPLPMKPGQRPELPRTGHPGPAEGQGGEPSVDLTRNMEQLLANQFGPPSVLVNDRGEALFFHGRTGRFLEPARGPIQNQLLEMARPGLRAPLSKALRDVTSAGAEEAGQRVHLQADGEAEEVLLEVRLVRAPRALRGFRLVTFRTPAAAEPEGPEEAPREAPEPAERAPEDRVVQLERELEAARQDKQVTVEELQASNEELQSLNEELQSMNEELQSSNEELEVSKEEVESLNEELRSVNAELESRVQELSGVNDDLKNLLDSTELAIVFLDEDLQIKRFTEAARQLISLRPMDVGRPIQELTTELQYEALTEDAEEVLSTLVPKEVEVQSTSGHWFQARLRPYRTTQNQIGGLVCTFRDIQTTKRMEFREAYFRAIVQTVREPLLVLDPELRVQSANDGFYRVFGLRPQEVEGRHLFEMGGGQWDHPELRALLEEVLPTDESFQDFELTADFGDQGPERVWLNGRQLQRDTGEPELILLTMATANAPSP